VIKIPRWTFEKFPDADETLTTQMKSVGEAMAIGRTFKEALQKGIRSLEVKRFGFGLDKYDKWLNAQKAAEKSGTGERGTVGRGTGGPPVSSSSQSSETKDHGRAAHATDDSDKTTQGESTDHEWPIPEGKLRRKLAVPSQGRMYYIRYAMKMGWTVEQIHELTNIDPWFLAQMKQLVDFEDDLVAVAPAARAEVERQKSRGRLAKDPTERAAWQRLGQVLYQAKPWGYSDVQLANVWGISTAAARALRHGPVYKIVDTCAAEFEASTPYYYSTYETPYRSIHDADPLTWEDEIRLTDRPKVIIIGGGPNRIGQGIEFDYCCVQAAFAMKELGLESVMINSNPETVSTDYDTSDLLFFEPLTHEDVLNVCERLNGGPFTREPVGSALADAARRQGDSASAKADPTSSASSSPSSNQAQGARTLGSPSKNLVKGVIVQFGGQTPLNLARGLKEAGVPILGTSVESLDAAGDREQFRTLLQELNLKQPENGIARSVAEAREIARRIGYPVLVRPSFVLGGRAMEIVSDEAQLNYYMANAVDASTIADAPILVDKFLDAATEVDVDCLADFDPVGSALADAGSARSDATASAKADPTSGGQAMIIGVMEHIEEAGIHSGDSACSLPPYSLSKDIVERLKTQTRALAKALRVRGLMNVQFAIKDNEIYLIEVNPRASRTVPFVSKAQGQSFAKIAAKVMAGKSLKELGIVEPHPPRHMSVKEVVFPFSKFPGVDIILGPEMRSTGEVMGIDADFPLAYAKAQIAAGSVLPTKGAVFVSVRDGDKEGVIPAAKLLAEAGFQLIATGGTFDALSKNAIPATRVSKLAEGRPNIRDLIKNGKIQLIINTPTKKGPLTDEGKIRALAVLNKVPIVTTITGAHAVAKAIGAMQKQGWGVRPLQDYFAKQVE
jgi:carbamoyl-phosphate synthase large subunit